MSDDIFNNVQSLAAMLDTNNISEAAEIKLDLIDFDSEQPRKEFNINKLEELTNSIRANGVVQPIIVKHVNNRYLLVTGERRVRASRQAGLDTIPAVLYSDKFIANNKLIFQFTENYGREDFTISEEISVVNELIKQHKKSSEVAQLLGVNKSWVSKRQKILKAGDKIKLLIQSGLTNDVEGVYQLSLLEKDHSEQVNTFVDDCIDQGTITQNLRKLKHSFVQPPMKK